MKIRRVSEKQKKQDFLIPDGYVQEGDLVLLCEEQDKEVGSAVLMKKAEDWVLNWIFVLPEERGKGYGSALLDAAVYEAGKNGGNSLKIYLQDEAPDSDLFLAMLSARNFFLSWEQIPKISATREQLKKAVFFTDPAFQKSLRDSRTQIFSLRQVTRQQLKNFRNLCEKKKNYLVSRADFERADLDQSKALVAEDAIVGIALIQSVRNEKILTLCYVEKKYQMELLSLFRRMAEEVLRGEEKTERISFYCISKNVEKLAEHVLPEHERLIEEVIVGKRIFYREA